MKQCSKCRLWRNETEYVKSDRYSDGLYPSCKKCRAITKERYLILNPMCCRCKSVAHAKGCEYCLDCHRIMCGRPAQRSRTYDPTNKTLCCKCKKNLRLAYHNYCRICKNASTVASLKKKRAPRPFRPLDPRRRKKSARHYINTLFKRGKIKRKPCEMCNDGTPSVHFHHLDYNDRTKNVMHVCLKHHVQLEREKRNLTKCGGDSNGVASVG